jgi:hypothetical protein
MKAFMLIIAFAGGPERVAMTCDTYLECSRAGAQAASAYVTMFHKTPDAVTYRVEPVEGSRFSCDYSRCEP